MAELAFPTALSFTEGLRHLLNAHNKRVREALWAEGKLASNKRDAEAERVLGEKIAETFKSLNPPQSLQSAAAEFASELERGAAPDLGLATGLIDIDRTLGKLQPGELIVVAARPGCGKSSLIRQICAQIAFDGQLCVLVSTEMGAKEIALSAARQISRVPWAKDRPVPNDQLETFRNAVKRISTLATFRLIEARQLAGLISKWTAMTQEEFPPVLYCVDYLQQLDAGMRKGETLAASVGRISGELKAFARDHKSVVLAAAQLNRESAKEGDPQLYHLRDSGAIEQDADRVIMLKLADNEPVDGRFCTVHVFQRKNRNGPLGDCRLTFDRWTQRFANYRSE